MAPEGFCSHLSKLHAAPRAARLRRSEDEAVLGYGERPADLEGAVVEVHVVPLQAEQLSLTEPGVYRQHVEGFKAVPRLVRHLKQEIGLLWRERVNLFAGRLRWLHGLGGIPGYQAIQHRLLEGLVERGVDVAYRAGRRSRLKLLPVESAHVGRREGLQLYPPKR